MGAFVTKGNNSENFSIRCVYCEEPHYSASCAKVVESEARRLILRDSKRCFNCLRKGHQASVCQNTKKCRYCEGKHHQSICSKGQTPPKVVNSKDQKDETPKPKQDGETKNNFCGTATLTRVSKGSVLLQTARAIATNGSNSTPVRILFDTGSQRSYVTNSITKQLKLNPVKRETLHLNTFGNNKSKRQNCEVFKFNIRSRKGGENIELRAINFPTICSPVKSEVNIENYPHLSDLELADIDEHATGNDSIDILVGADFYWHFVTGDVVRGDNSPTAISSKLGWLLSGPSTQDSTDNSTRSNLILAGESIDDSNLQTDRDIELTSALNRFWETESIGIKSTEENHPDRNSFLRDIRFTGKRYEVELPWKEERPEIETDYDLCYNRLKLLYRKLQKQPQLLAEYNKNIEDQLRNGIVEEVPASENEEEQRSVHYLPHHGVVRQDKTTTKLRVVYDGSATTATREHSLNDCLLTGPNYIPQIFDILVKFRINPVGIVADIEKAFLMVGISEKDRDMLRFLWFKNIEHHDPELVKLRFCRLVFGLRPSPAILGATINHHLDACKNNKVDMVERLRDSLYVDDFVSGAEDDEKAFEVYNESKEIMRTGGFNLRKWHSNSSNLMKSINSVEHEVDANSNTSTVLEEDLSFAKASIAQQSTARGETQVKVLGSIWDTNADTLLFDFNELVEYAKTLHMTKRSLLKWSSKIFDPLGFLTPFTIKLKVLFQELCLAKTDWDHELDEKTRKELDVLISELASLSNVPVQRCYFVLKLKPAVIQIHGFSDASERAFAAVVYLRTVYENGQIDVNLIASKAKVAPTKKQTIPRLELLGATILARLVSSVSKTLSLDVEIFYWVDSTATLCWIRNERLWKQYVQNRVSEIRSLSSPEEWHFCPGSLNPADLPSRGIADKIRDKESVWYKGPEFLSQPEDQWPSDPVATNSDEILSEVVKQPPGVVRSLAVKESESDATHADISTIIDINRFSTLKKLLRVTAYVTRFINALKKTKFREQSNTRELNFLSAAEIEHAELRWIKSVQSLSFAKELEFLQRKSEHSTPQYVKQFGLFVDENHVLRCKGRLSNSSLDFGNKTYGDKC